MDHEQAILTYAPMRYTLGELAATERDSLEDHFVDCSFCLQDVEASIAFASNVQVLIPPGARFFPLLLGMDIVPPAARYQCELRSGSPAISYDRVLKIPRNLVLEEGVP